jgi:Chaperone of endosialidase
MFFASSGPATNRINTAGGTKERTMNPVIQFKTTILPCLIACALVCFGLSPASRAVTPPPDGGYPNRNTAEGDFALFSADVEAGNDNTAIGFSTLYSNVGSFNTAIGSEALYSNTGSHDNTATGSFALHTNTIGNENTATGAGALLRNTIGNDNTATGVAALQSNTTGEFNTATGVAALASNTTGNNNTANGVSALGSNRTGSSNTATGVNALFNNRGSSNNTATGAEALDVNTTGNNNTADGFRALSQNTTGNNNTAEGFRALFSNTTGNNNVALGFNAGLNLTTGSNNIDIGNVGAAGESSTIRIGLSQTRTFIAGISGVAVTGSPVVVNSNGRLGVTASSARFKEAIKPMDKASEAILALQPVTFRYKPDLDPDGIPQFGLIAEQVEKVNPHLVMRDAEGKVYTVRYEAVNAMLLNEFLKEHCKNEEQQATITELKSGMEALTAMVKEQAAQIQKVNARVGMSTLQVAENNQ